MKDKSYETVFEYGKPKDGWFGIQVKTDLNTARWIQKNKIWFGFLPSESWWESSF